MHALVHTFLRCVSLLLPSHWLQFGFCWWIEDECGKTIWPNPRARFKGRKPLTDQEVSAHNAFIPSSSPAPSCIPLAASPSPPQDNPQGRIRELWQFLERFFGIALTIHQHWFPKRRPLFAQYPFTCKSATDGIEDSAVAAERTQNIVPAEDCNEPKRNEGFIQDGMSAAMELSCPGESMSDSARLIAVDEVGADDKQLQVMVTQVKITVAIQAAEDEEPEDENSSNPVDFLEGSGSDDEVGRHDKSSGAGTSGGELEEVSWQPPDPELMEKLVTQIEYYLSDENLEHDAFLLKHVRRNKLGFVSVKLLTSFKKVKHLTRDWRTTAYALRQSTLLELNEEGRKVRRRSPVPVFASESLPSRMLLLSALQNWPELDVALEGGAGDGEGGGGVTQQERLMELLLKGFGTYGPIASVRVLKAGKELPADLKKLSGRYTQLGLEECAIVEYEEVEAAVRAHEAVAGEEEGTSTLGVKVVLIGMKPPKKKVLRERPREEGGMRKSRSLNSRVRELQYLDESTCSSSETESNPATPRLVRKTQSLNKLSPTGGGAGLLQNNHLSPALSPRSSPWSSPRVSPRTSPCPQRKSPHIQMSPLASEGRLSPESGRRWADYSSDSSLTPLGSPWVQRRRQVASLESSPVGSPMLGRKIQNADGLPPGVVRLPRGPDGTRGFHNPSVEERGKTAATQT
ncbi:la-related protein 6-like [Conger conger]|uniref:la-related protein 6-like n=1 Tax=Conger conger TaxID=82655 RepID=UPI002A5AF426|nr:la-related protein 6-like [Conger conger]